MAKFRKKPVVIDAIVWEGDDSECLQRFCGLNWARADARDHAWSNRDDGEQVIVWNALDNQWLEVPVGFYIIRGIEGELYPCDPSVFEKTYELV